MQDIVAKFEEKNPSIKIKLIDAPTASSPAFETLLRSSEVAGTTPDVTFLFAGGQILQNAKFLLPLNQLISAEFKASLYIGWRFATANFGTTGDIYGVPYGAGYWYFVYYNKALFEKAAVTAPNSAISWPELMNLAKRIKARGITPFIFGEKEGYFGAWTQDALISSMEGTDGVLEMFSGKKSLDSGSVVDAYTAWGEPHQEGLTNSDATTLNSNQGIAQFAAGRGAMTITGGFSNPAIDKGLGSNIGIFPAASLAGARYPKSLSGGPNNDYVIFKTCKNPEAAFTWIQYLVSPEVQEINLQNQFGQLPNNKSYVAGPDLAKIDPILAQTYKFLRTEHYQLFEAFDNVMPGSIDTFWYQTNSAVFSGSQSPSQAAKSLNQQMVTYLQQNPGSK